MGCPITPSNLVLPLSTSCSRNTESKCRRSGVKPQLRLEARRRGAVHVYGSVLSCWWRLTLVLGLLFGFEELIVVVGKEMLLAASLQDVVEVVGLRGLEGGADRLPARAGDRSGRKTAIFVGVVRRLDLQIVEREILLGLVQDILYGSVYLQGHAGADAVVDHAGYERAFLGVGGLLFDEGGRGYELVLCKVESPLCSLEIEFSPLNVVLF